MDEMKKLDSENLKMVSGGKKVTESCRCPYCGEWNDFEHETSDEPTWPPQVVKVTFICWNCGGEYSCSYKL